MAVYAITGAASGIGAELRQQLEGAGHRVLWADLHAGDVRADLATVEGRQAVVAGLSMLAPGGLDGFIPCAGLPPVAQPRDLIPRVNYFAVLETLTGLAPLLAKKSGTALLVASNSAPMVALDDPYVQACLGGDEAAACEALSGRDGHTAYAGAKRALVAWMRRKVTAYAASGVRLNAVAPGITRTPLSERVLADAEMGPAIRAFGEQVPLGAAASPAQVAAVMAFMLSPAANFVCGSLFYVDGGSDAMLRPDAV